jgi:hypothetical protein
VSARSEEVHSVRNTDPSGERIGTSLTAWERGLAEYLARDLAGSGFSSVELSKYG